MLEIKREILEEIFDHCLREIPNEACGILAGKNGKIEKVFMLTNTEASPSAYFIDSKEQLRVMKEIEKSNLEMVAIYHSHVEADAYPSGRDVELAFYPEVFYLIVSLKDQDKPIARIFRIREKEIVEEGLKVI